MFSIYKEISKRGSFYAVLGKKEFLFIFYK